MYHIWPFQRERTEVTEHAVRLFVTSLKQLFYSLVMPLFRFLSVPYKHMTLIYKGRVLLRGTSHEFA